MLHFRWVLPSGSHKDCSSWLDPADNSKLFALRNESAGPGCSLGFWLREMSLKLCIIVESGISQFHRHERLWDSNSQLVGQSQTAPHPPQKRKKKEKYVAHGRPDASLGDINFKLIVFEEKIAWCSSLLKNKSHFHRLVGLDFVPDINVFTLGTLWTLRS